MSVGRMGGGVLVALSIAVSGCTSPGVAPSATAPAPPAATAAPARAQLREVAVADLPVGEASDDPIQVTPGTLHQGDLVWVVRADDAERAAHLVAAAGAEVDEAAMPFGWVPADVGGAPSLREADVNCPERATTLQTLAALKPIGGLACFGGEPITFVGFTPIGCGAGGSPRTGTPDWLNGTWSGIGIAVEEPVAPDFAVAVSVSARLAPDLPLEPCGSGGWYRFVGHFDDPASSTCRTETTTPDGTRSISVEPLLSELLCRMQLVLTEAAPLTAAP